MASCITLSALSPCKPHASCVSSRGRAHGTVRAARAAKTAGVRAHFSDASMAQLRGLSCGRSAISVRRRGSSSQTVACAPVDQGEIVPEGGTQVSFGAVGLAVGISLLLYGFGAFFNFLPGASVSSVLLIYGFPVSLIGAALQYAKLDPVPRITYAKADAVRESQATAIQNQIISDVTRYRYGDEQHLDEALKRIFRIGQAGGISRRKVPILTALREIIVDDKYTLVLVFDDSCELEEFTARQAKIQSFFGPGISATITGIEGGVEVALISEGTNAGAYDEDEWELLPPLQPGQPPRRVKKGSV